MKILYSLCCIIGVFVYTNTAYSFTHNSNHDYTFQSLSTKSQTPLNNSFLSLPSSLNDNTKQTKLASVTFISKGSLDYEMSESSSGNCTADNYPYTSEMGLANCETIEKCRDKNIIRARCTSCKGNMTLQDYKCSCDRTHYTHDMYQNPCVYAYAQEDYCQEIGPDNVLKTFYADCSCPSDWSECNDEGEEGFGGACTAGGKVYYFGCTCKNPYTLTCTGSNGSGHYDEAPSGKYCESVVTHTRYYKNCAEVCWNGYYHSAEDWWNQTCCQPICVGYPVTSSNCLSSIGDCEVCPQDNTLARYTRCNESVYSGQGHYSHHILEDGDCPMQSCESLGYVPDSSLPPNVRNNTALYDTSSNSPCYDGTYGNVKVVCRIGTYQNGACDFSSVQIGDPISIYSSNVPIGVVFDKGADYIKIVGYHNMCSSGDYLITDTSLGSGFATAVQGFPYCVNGQSQAMTDSHGGEQTQFLQSYSEDNHLMTNSYVGYISTMNGYADSFSREIGWRLPTMEEMQKMFDNEQAILAGSAAMGASSGNGPLCGGLSYGRQLTSTIDCDGNMWVLDSSNNPVKVSPENAFGHSTYVMTVHN